MTARTARIEIVISNSISVNPADLPLGWLDPHELDG